MRLVERHGAKGRRDVVGLGGVGLPCCGCNGEVCRVRNGHVGCVIPRSLDVEVERNVFPAGILRTVRITDGLSHRDFHGRGGERIGDVRSALNNARFLSLGPRNGTVRLGHRELVGCLVQLVAKRRLGLRERVRARQQTLELELAIGGIRICPLVADSFRIRIVINHSQGCSVRNFGTIGILYLGKRPLGTSQRSVSRVALLNLGPRHRTGDLGVGDGARGVGIIE